MGEVYDFGGYATKNDIKCLDGRTIRKDAFKDCDGITVPLVWQHDHGDPTKVLGHAVLENRDDGMYAKAFFNSTDIGKHAKELVKHGDVKSLSIYANQLKQRGGDVLHGVIREVSLVLAGANPGALIDDLNFEHSADDDWEDGEAIIYNGENLELSHAAEEKKEDKEEKEVAGSEETVKDIIDSMNEKQKNVMEYLIAQALESGAGQDDKENEGEEMKHNLFDKDTPETSLSHADMEKFFKDAKRIGSLREAVNDNLSSDGFLAHALSDRFGNQVDYGIADIDYLFPEAREMNNPPSYIKEEDDWVSRVMGGVHHTPFSRIKTTFANITMDEARAKGYIKGNKKKEEVFSLLKRTTDPQTVYKKQKMDRDDIIDITDFDVVAWIKSEMRVKLDEELARAFLIGDGRLDSDDDKISPAHIRPIWTDDDLFTIKVPVTAGADDAATAKNMIKAIIRGYEDFDGSGEPTFYTTQKWLTEMLLLEDGIGHFLYPNKSVLATTLRVKDIVVVPAMKNQTRGGAALAGIIVNLTDYNVGADKGGSVSMFEDFDIDYNQEKYLIETRCSGTLVKPFSAMAIEVGGTATTYTAVIPVGTENPHSEGWYEKQGILYVLTPDTEIVEGKTYYAKS